ncbi:uncharacterized protein LOC111436525 [Cucurbita moschata]|uniref:Uncharacterized protein LOC111436525 n=1 Tax=Cucurbita moschata TaxID=3662 RepID=A0A6J1EQI6_CUCMO|nr:uncharacterized protein LOC111436525 [Cucurbita moschata]
MEECSIATPRTADSSLDADHDDDLVARYWRMEDLVGGGESPRIGERELEQEVDELHVISADELNTLGVIRKEPKHGHGEQRLIVGVYVDDLIIIGGDMKVLGIFKREMSKNFKMSNLGVFSYYLGIEVQQSTASITICQCAYTKKLLDIAGLVNSNPTRKPMEARLQLRKVSTTTTVNSTNYRSIVGSLHYLVNTRPSLAYSVGYVSRFMEAPREEILWLSSASCIMWWEPEAGV